MTIMTDHRPESESRHSHTVPQLLEGISEDQLKAEFKFLCDSTENLPKQDISLRKENVDKNRWKGFYAYDHSRVVLEPGEDDEDYINANYIPNYLGDTMAFIATQGPLKCTVNDFWRMVWQEKVNRIIMVTNLNESDTQHNLCAKYWPESEPITCGKITISRDRVETSLHITTRFFTIFSGSESRRVIHFHYLGWVDRGVPSSTGSLLRFWQEVEKYDGGAVSPVIMHCSAGVGRTGTFLAMSQAIRQVIATGEVSICDYVIEMRQSRYRMVQNLDQYVFIFAALRHALKTDILETKDFQTIDFGPIGEDSGLNVGKESSLEEGTIEDEQVSR